MQGVIDKGHQESLGFAGAGARGNDCVFAGFDVAKGEFLDVLDQGYSAFCRKDESIQPMSRTSCAASRRDAVLVFVDAVELEDGF